MASEIRRILARAQQAEIAGRVEEAVQLLTEAAEAFHGRGMELRSQQVLRHIERLEQAPAGPDVGPDSATAARSQKAVELRLAERRPVRADPGIDAWCSFCCRPRREAGELVSGPAGAFLCANCAQTAGELLGGPGAGPRLADDEPVAAVPAFLLPCQAMAWRTLALRSPRLALLVGPEGVGKTALLERLGARTALPWRLPASDLALLDLEVGLGAEDEGALLQWLGDHPRRRAVLAARGAPPAPALVLTGEAGETALHETAALHAAVDGRLSVRLLARVDAVLPLVPPGVEALTQLALSLLGGRGIALPEEVVARVVRLAERSGRGAHELTALVARIPAGSYGQPR